MYIKPITYTTFEDEPKEVTEKFHFHLSKREVIRYAAKHDGGIKGMIQAMAKETSEDRILQMMEDIVLMSYGERTEDGKGFNKNDALREKFRNSAAYNALFDEFMEADSTAGAMADFINGIFPADMVAASEAALAAAGGDAQKALATAAAGLDEAQPQTT